MPDFTTDVLLVDLVAYLATGILMSVLAARALGFLGCRPVHRPMHHLFATSAADPRTGVPGPAAASRPSESEDAPPANVSVLA